MSVDAKLKVKHLGVRELRLSGNALEADIIPGAFILVRSNENGAGRPHLVQYAVLEGSVDAQRLPKTACLVEDGHRLVSYPTNYNHTGGAFERVYGEPEFKKK